MIYEQKAINYVKSPKLDNGVVVLAFSKDYQVISWGVVTTNVFDEEKWKSYRLRRRVCYELHVAQPKRKFKGKTTTSCVMGTNYACSAQTFQEYWKRFPIYR